MTTVTIEKDTAAKPTTGDRIVDGSRHAAHLTHEARLLKSVAEDAIEEGLHKAKRAVRRRVREIQDLRDDAVRQVRRQPLAAVGAALGAGLLTGLVAGLVIGRSKRRA
jgi:ElaB/YqjD/DUF883 family membrane-anchored ribosome-binding protein